MKSYILLLFVISGFCSESFTKSKLREYQIISDKNKTCILAPEAKTKEEKIATFTFAAESYLAGQKTTKKEGTLCLAFIKPTSKDTGNVNSIINAYSYPGGGYETVKPGYVKWTKTGASFSYKVVMKKGYDVSTAYEYVQLMLKYVRGEGCSIEDEIEGCVTDFDVVAKLIHRDLGIKSHPLDKVIPD